jgi:dienelactone hydrolase
MKIASSRLRLFIVLLVALSVSSCANGPTPKAIERPKDPDTVSFQSSAAHTGGGALNLTGRLKKPDGGGPFPAVILLHGCGGISPKRDHRWAERLSDWGYVTLQVDSFRPRGLKSVCTYSGSASTDILRKRVTDAYDAKRYLAGLPFVDRSRIAVMGWSHGGATTLQTLYPKTDDPFRAAIAFYPSCRRILTDLNSPLLILIGEADDWTPSSRCVEMLPKEQGVSEVTLKVYAGAYHGFDTLDANTNVRGSSGMHHLQYHPEAAADSILRVRAFFEKHMK